MENYKEKYQQALERAKGMYEQGMMPERIEYIFPELKESDDDRIKEKIIHLVKKSNEYGGYALHKDEADRMINWLEKQGEQKSIWSEENNCYYDDICEILINLINSPKSNVNKDAVQKDLNWLMSIKELQSKPTRSEESKFKVGDWVVLEDSLSTYKIVEVCKSWYEVISNNDGMQYSISFDEENDCRLWTAKEAKDGDVLASHECIVLLKEIDGLNIKCYCTFYYMNNPSFYVDTLQYKNAFSPATKEQRDLFFEKMKEAGYKWDAVEKKLVKLPWCKS